MNAAAGEMLGTECTFRKLSTDEEGSCYGEAFLRCINDKNLEQDIQSMKQIASKYDVEIEVEENEYYRPSSLESKGYKYVKQAVENVFDYAATVPFILPAGTDARHFTYICDAVIRFAPIDIDNQQYSSVHNENENFSIDKLSLVVEFYKELIKNYR